MIITKERRTETVAVELRIWPFVKVMLQMYCLFFLNKTFFSIRVHFYESHKIKRQNL